MPTENFVLRSGKIFEVGDYPSHDFSLTEEEMERAVASFSPVDVDIEHIPSVLSGKMGQLKAVRLGEDRKSLLGDWHIPAWLDGAISDAERKVSLTWDRATKAIAGMALVRTPRISDAALFAAFTATHPEANPVIPPDLEPAPATFATPRKRDDELTASMQSMHDHIAANHPWACSGGTAFGDRPKQFKAVKSMHDDTVSHGASCPGPSKSAGMSGGAPATETEESDMDLVKFREAVGKLPDPATPEEIRAALALAPADVLASFSAAKPAPVAEPESPAMRELREEMDSIRAEREAERLAGVERDAAAFALEQFRAGKVLDKATVNLVALFKQAAADDHARKDKVSFSADDKPVQGSRLEALKAFLADVTPHGLFVPATGNGDVQAIFNRRGGAPADDGAVTDAAHEKNLSYTEAGRAILAAKQKGA